MDRRAVRSVNKDIMKLLLYSGAFGTMGGGTFWDILVPAV